MHRYGGIFERGTKEYTLDDFYALQLDKMDRYTCLKKSDVVIPEEWEEESSEEDDEEEDDDDDDEEDDEEDEEGSDGDELGTVQQVPMEVKIEAEEVEEDPVSDL